MNPEENNPGAPAPTPENPPAPVATDKPKEAKPFYKKPWFWWTVGGAAAVATGVTVACVCHAHKKKAALAAVAPAVGEVGGEVALGLLRALY